jgi:hypothetical protein
MSARWLGERITVPPHIEAWEREHRSVWQVCPTCRRRYFGQRSPTCMACDPTLRQVQPGVYVKR